MRIKRLEIQGFKSFAERAVLNFGRGVTGVVGPNGCGKSNIIDAIRWCMGEMSAKHLRGSAMQDVIFAGSDSMGPLGMAEVTLTFHNDGSVPPQYADYGEISVSRRLHRDGTSEYLINKVQVRLRDIVDLFLGTGVGTRAYSIIEQGRVGFIVSSKPEQRRTLIEEVAGVTKFKVRRKAAERRMKSTEQNLLRVNDIINELERQLASLKRQAQKAERYKRLRNEVRDLDLHVASVRILELMSESRVKDAQLKSLLGEVEDGESLIATLEAGLEVDKLRLLEEEEQVQVHQRRSVEADTTLVGLERDLNHWQDQAAETTHRIEDTAGDNLETQSSLSEARTELLRLREEIETLAHSASDDHELLARGEAQVSQAQGAVSEVDRRLEVFRRDALEKVHGSAQQRTQLTSLEREREKITQRLELAGQEERTVQENRVRAEEDQAHLRERHSEVTTGLEGGRERHRVLQERHEVVVASAEEATDRLIGLRGEFSEKSARLASLQEIAQRLEGFPEGVRVILGKGEASDHPPVPTEVVEGLLGTITDAIRVPQKFERALESAIGGVLDYLVVKEHGTGLAALNYLQQIEGGRSGFIPADLLCEPPAPMPKVEGTLGRATDLVEVTEGCEGISQLLLHHIYVVETLEQAERLLVGGAFNDLPGAVMVTLAGDRIECSGLVAGGALTDGGVFAREREIRELESAVERLAGALEECSFRQEELEEQRTTNESELRQLDQDIRSADIEQAELTKDVEVAGSNVQRFVERAEVLSFEREQRIEELEAIEVERVAALQAAEEAEEGQGVIEEEIQSLHRDRLELVGALEAASEEFTILKVKISGRDEKLAAMTMSLQRLVSREEELEQRIERNERFLEEGNDLVLDLREKIAEGRASSESMVLLAQELREQLSVTRGAYEENRANINVVENRLREQRRGGQSRQEQLGECRLALQRIEMDRLRLIDQIEERYDLNLLSVLSDYHTRPLPGEEEQQRKEELDRKIKTMGSINLTAIEECAAVEERHHFLTEQRQDLKDALDSLKRAINRINRVSRERFEAAFHSVNDMFVKVFPRLFRGGEARLELVDSEDMLEAGVDIIAMPPGKKLQNVGLLSGGEKALTATALIFSIFLIKPSPFCVLDEVDAPLDEANVGRFNEMLREISKVSQFIVITHNKQTMTSVDRLYGITMEEAGRSKVVSVNLEASSRHQAA